MEKNNKQQKQTDYNYPTTASLASSLSAVLIGFSVAIITIMITNDGFLIKYPNGEYLLSLFILTIIFFLFSIEFFMLSTWDKQNFSIWIILGSILYGLGYGWFIIGLSLTFKILITSSFLAYFTLTIFLLFEIIYNIIRGKLAKEHFYMKSRFLIRGIMFLQIFSGYIALYLLN